MAQMMHIALCSNLEVFKGDRLRDKQWSRRFPGSGWVTCLYQLGVESCVNIVSGDIAIENIKTHKWMAKEVLVIQDLTSQEAGYLLSMGAVPFMITCFESPIYEPNFYKYAEKISRKFKYKLGFSFANDGVGIDKSDGVLECKFPSYYREDMRDIRPWSTRKNIVAVAANKYRTNKIYRPKRLTFMAVARQIKTIMWRLRSASFKRALAESLHDQRLEVLAFFAEQRNIDIYGKDWDNWGELPNNLAKRFEEVIHGAYMGICQDKLDLISNYRFSLCFENMVRPGYITEKIIDCFVAGTLPIYFGAPDIEDYLPSNSYVDVRKFASYEQLRVFLSSMDEKDALDMIKAGRDYLKTDLGQMHSYEGFSLNIFRLIKTC